MPEKLKAGGSKASRKKTKLPKYKKEDHLISPKARWQLPPTQWYSVLEITRGALAQYMAKKNSKSRYLPIFGINREGSAPSSTALPLHCCAQASPGPSIYFRRIPVYISNNDRGANHSGAWWLGGTPGKFPGGPL